MKIIAPLPPNMANSRRHWRVTLREKKAYWSKCDLLVDVLWEGGCPPVDVITPTSDFGRNTPVPLTPARISATLFMPRHMDDDNAMNRLKWLMDWLVAYGYIAGDSRKHITWAGLPEQVIDRRNPRVELTIEAA